MKTLIKTLKFKREERAFLTPKDQVKHAIRIATRRRINLTPVHSGAGYTTKYVVRTKDKTYFLKIANKHAERRMSRVVPERRHFYPGRLSREYEVLSKLSQLKLAPKPVLRDKSFLMMEFAQGKLLSEVLASPQTRTETKLVLTKKAFEAIVKIHQKGIIFPDLSPTNIIVNAGDLKFIDFEIYFANYVPKEDQLVFALSKYISRLQRIKSLCCDTIYKQAKQFIAKYPGGVQEKLAPMIERFKNGN